MEENNLEHQKKGMNPVLTGLVGAAVGAGVAAAATTLMSNKKARNAVFHTVDMAREKVAHTLQTARQRARKIRHTAGREANSAARRLGI